MKYYIFHLKWSQTDQEYKIIKANSLENAKLRASRLGARYCDYYATVDNVLE